MASADASATRAQIAWWVLRVLFVLETGFMAWALIFTITGATSGGGDVLQNLSLIIIAALALLWVVLSLLGSLRARSSWVRGSALTIHVLLFAAGSGIKQLALGSDAVAVPLMLAAVVGFAAVLLARPAQQESGAGQAEEE